MGFLHTNLSLTLPFLIFVTRNCLILALDPPNLSKHPVVIIVSFDGFRYDYMSKTRTPNLDRVKENGVSVPYMRNQFPTNTLPNHHSIVTGLYPESHGIVSNIVYDPFYKKELVGYMYDPGYWNFSTAVDALTSPIVPLYTSNELAGDGRHSGSMMWPGGQVNWGESQTTTTHHIKYNISIWNWEWEVDGVLEWIIHPTKPANLVYMYIQEPDYTGHEFGPESQQIIEEIQRIDNVTGYLLNKLDALGILGKVHLIFLSDHGMQEIKPLAAAKFRHVIDNTNNSVYYEYGKKSGVMQIRPVRENETLKIFNAFNSAAEGNHYKVYLRDEVAKTKPNWHFVKNRRIMPIFMTPELGYVLEPDEPRNYTWGAHGYDTCQPSMRAFFVAMGPLFKNNSVLEPFDNIDLYPLICHMLNIEPRPHNGSLDHVLPLLASSGT